MIKKDKDKLILDTLDIMFPDAKGELNHKNDFELLIAVVLSAQTTDKAVNNITPLLFSKYPDAFALSEANEDDVMMIINRIGLYKVKSKNIIKLSKLLVEKHRGIVPNNRESLEALPGVGRKTANVVMSIAFNIPAIAVDTHVERVSKRLGLANKSDNVLEVEKKLMKRFPENRWTKLHHQLIFFGRYHCTAKKPKCNECALKDICIFYKEFKKN
ncbi:endonuclease III [Haploplasma axanthum]|uniref:Endonuclease III n=1 Tax=Haploplasma axanthum TaxID=29552 RepID=A0A449BD47_HAPAX|nr:endonuclease III [Haploplasma axanthum]VEU80355.1 Endonuclease III [Haploplasma axanthum]